MLPLYTIGSSKTFMEQKESQIGKAQEFYGSVTLSVTALAVAMLGHEFQLCPTSFDNPFYH